MVANLFQHKNRQLEISRCLFLNSSKRQVSSNHDSLLYYSMLESLALYFTVTSIIPQNDKLLNIIEPRRFLSVFSTVNDDKFVNTRRNNSGPGLTTPCSGRTSSSIHIQSHWVRICCSNLINKQAKFIQYSVHSGR